MCRQLRFLNLCSYSRNNYCGTEPIPDVVLNNENRAHTALVRANDWGQVCKINVSTFNIQRFIPRLLSVQPYALPHTLLESFPKQLLNLSLPFPYSLFSWIHEYV